MSLPTHQQTQQYQRATTGLQLRDWLADPDHAAESPSASTSSSPLVPASSSSSVPEAPVTPGSSTAATTAATTMATTGATTAATTADQRRRAAVADAALVIPDRVRLQLDTVLFGQRAPLGSTGPDAAPRSKNLTLLVGTLRTRTTRSGRFQCEISDLGAVRYRYELSINELFASPTGMAYASYRFPITMTDAVLAQCVPTSTTGPVRRPSRSAS